jgi:sec-independent protein translocase protein TatB
MLDIAWPELVVIGAVALVAIGPKDLPKVMHTLGRWVGKARAFAREIQSGFEQLSYEAEVAEKLKKEPPPSPPPTTPDTDKRE